MGPPSDARMVDDLNLRSEVWDAAWRHLAYSCIMHFESRVESANLKRLVYTN